MYQPSSPLLLLNDQNSVSAGVAGDGPAERLADLSDCARRLNRPQQADRFLLLAWLAFDARSVGWRDRPRR